MVNYDKHLNVKDVDDLEEYIFGMLRSKFGHYVDYNFVSINDNELVAMFAGVPFAVEYERGKNATLIVKVDAYKKGKEVLETIKRIVSPVMWYIDENAKNPRNYVAPLVRYKVDGYEYYTWDVFNPEDRLDFMAFDIFVLKKKYDEFKIFYPDRSLEDLKNRLLYGEFLSFFDDEGRGLYDNASEFEVFSLLADLMQSEEELQYKKKTLEQEIELHKYHFAIAYLIQRTKDFGVKVEPPSLEFKEPSIEFQAWYKWWLTAFDDLLDKDPDILNKWEKYENGFDPEFRPTGSFHDYEEEVRQERGEYVKFLFDEDEK